MLDSALTKLALDTGFTNAAMFPPEKLRVLEAVRDMCSDNRCSRFGKCWTCPPYCGSLEECAGRIAGHDRGLLVCTTARLEDSFDYEGMMAAEKTHKANFQRLLRQLRPELENLLPLGVGSCTLCPECSCPDAPCRHPDLAHPSMESYGLLITDVCELAGIPYYYGTGTVSYFSCYLFNQ